MNDKVVLSVVGRGVGLAAAAAAMMSRDIAGDDVLIAERDVMGCAEVTRHELNDAHDVLLNDLADDMTLRIVGRDIDMPSINIPLDLPRYNLSSHNGFNRRTILNDKQRAPLTAEQRVNRTPGGKPGSRECLRRVRQHGGVTQ